VLSSDPSDLLHELLTAPSAPVVRALDNLGVALCVMLDDGKGLRVVYASEAIAGLLGYTSEEIVGYDSFFFVAPDELPRLAELRRSVVGGQRTSPFLEIVALRKDGSRIPLEIGTARVSLDGEDAVIAFCRDITERRRIQMALERSELRFRQLIESAPDAIAVLRNGRFAYVNPGFLRIWGYASPSELLCRPAADFIAPEDRRAFAERLTGAAEEVGPSPHEHRIVRRDGSRGSVEIVSLPFDFEGTPAVLGFARDVTERKRLQAQVMQSDRMATLGLLAAGVAHDVNNPLAYLSLTLHQMSRDLARIPAEPALLPDLQQRMADAVSGIGQVAEIVRNLRTFARLDGGEDGQADVARALTTALKIADHEIRYRAQLTVDIGTLPLVRGSEGRLGQVFLNVLINAAQALPDGPAQRHEIRVCAQRVGERIVVDISDTGVGIRAEMRQQIFDPFFTTKGPGVGMGLGLSICREVIQRAGGDIQVGDSDFGRGARFRISLPVPAGEWPAVKASPAPDAVRANVRGRVLVVDDDRTVAGAVATLLQDQHEVTVATSGRAGLEQLLAAEFDAVVCDVMMPDLPGVDLYERIARERPSLARRFIFVTGGAFTPHATAFLESVTLPILEKPFSAERVCALVRAVVAREEA
jgi:PAS domain S-box-containing protein